MQSHSHADPVRPFSDHNLMPAILKALAEQGYASPTPIQTQAIPHLQAGRDLLGIAQTGTGKTAAFALPILERLVQAARPARPGRPQALILAPTRELAGQIAQSFAAYGKYLPLRGTVAFGGVGQAPQVRALRAGVHILVATPGRLLDLMNQGHVRLDDVSVFVLDEADRMLDMGFLRDVRRIMAPLPAERQSLLFSATMPAGIADLGRTLLRDPVRVEVTPPSTTVERVRQEVRFVAKHAKLQSLSDILRDESIDRVLVFTRTKRGADRVNRHLTGTGVNSAALHGNKSQGAREKALDGFRQGRVRVLVATDIAARGLDVPEITHVVNYDLPNEPESYVHRIGRTARAGREGVAVSLCDGSERGFLRDIERQIRSQLVVTHGAGTPDSMGREERQPRRPVSRRRGGGRPQGRGRRPASRYPV